MVLSHALRRLSTLVVLVAIAVGPSVVSSGAAAAVLSPPAVPSSGLYFGASASTRTGETKQDAILRTESQIGRPLALDHQFYKWNQTLPTPHQSWDVAGGRIPFVSWKPARTDGTSVTWTRITSGAEDTWITAQADRIRDFGHPLFMVFNHEPFDQSQNGWGTPADFTAAWRHIVDIFRARGASNVGWVLVLTGWDYSVSGRADAFYPGDNYVDWVAADPYNFFTRDGVWRELGTTASSFYTWGSAKNKPLMLAEWGCEEDFANPGRKAQWFDNARAWLKTHPNIKALAYYNNKQLYEWSIDTSSSSQTSFAGMANDPWFTASAAAATTTTTTAPTTTTTAAPTTTTTTAAPTTTTTLAPTTTTTTAPPPAPAETPTVTVSGDPYTPIGNFPYSENSGVVQSRRYPGIVWTHRDGGSGTRNVVYAFQVVDGALKQFPSGELYKAFPVAGTTNVDWEDIAIDDSGNLYIGDFGNNGGGRTNLKVYKVREPDPFTATSATLLATYPFKYPTTNHNAESMFVSDGDIYILNKVTPPTPHTIFRFGTLANGVQTTLTRVRELAEPAGGGFVDGEERLTGADLSPDGRWLAVTAKYRSYLYATTSALTGEARIKDLASRAPIWSQAHLRDGSAEQVEGITFLGGRLLTSSEVAGRIRHIATTLSGGSAPAPEPTPEPTPTPTPSGAVTFAAAADARVTKSKPSQNYGTSSLLTGDANPVTETFVRFDVAGVTAPVTRARLRLYVTNQSANGPGVYPSATTWSETGVTWNTRPARTGSLVADTGALASGRYVEWDVTKLVTGNGTYSLNLASDSSDGTDFNSREAGANKPQLVVEFG